MMSKEAFHKGIREDGTVEGYAVETYYRPCESIGDDEEGFLRVVIDDDATDLETRIPHSALIAAGWVKSPTIPADVGRRAMEAHMEATEAFLEAQDALDNRELHGPNAEDYFILLRRRNAARRDLEAAITELQQALGEKK